MGGIYRKDPFIIFKYQLSRLNAISFVTLWYEANTVSQKKRSEIENGAKCIYVLSKYILISLLLNRDYGSDQQLPLVRSPKLNTWQAEAFDMCNISVHIYG